MNDLISRQAAINAAKRTDYRGLTVEDVKKVTDAVVEELKALPSAQPEITEDDVKEYCRKRCLIVVTSDLYDEMMKRWSQPERKRGKWIDITKCGGASCWKCDECGELFLEDFYYCPNCGADMREANESHTT